MQVELEEWTYLFGYLSSNIWFVLNFFFLDVVPKN